MKGKKNTNWNIGTVIFGALFIYLLIMIVVYLLSDHVTSYMVTTGTLSRNETYVALAVRQEQIARSPGDGYVNYYVLDSGKTAKGAVVCSITGKKNELTSVRLSEADLGAVRKMASQFAHTYRGDDFRQTYDLKYAMNSSIVNNASAGTISGMVSEAPIDGIVSYTMDGLEDMTVEKVRAEDFRNTNSSSELLRTEETVAAGAPLYRVISSERWSLVFPVSDRQYAELSSKETVRVRFAKDNASENGDLSLFDKDGTHFAQIDFYSGMVRYCNDRYLDIELVTNTQNGLKLPLSAIVTKEFFTIPVSFLSSGGESGDAGFLVQRRQEDGSKTTVFTPAELYEKAQPRRKGNTSPEEVYYVDPDVFHKGDVIVKPDSQNTYTVGESASLEGVYCTNRGYAFFRKIELIDQNEDYCIVRTGTEYGLSPYDYIVRNAQDVKEEQILSGKARG